MEICINEKGQGARKEHSYPWSTGFFFSFKRNGEGSPSKNNSKKTRYTLAKESHDTATSL